MKIKNIITVLLALCMLFPCVASAAEIEENEVEVKDLDIQSEEIDNKNYNFIIKYDILENKEQIIELVKNNNGIIIDELDIVNGLAVSMNMDALAVIKLNEHITDAEKNYEYKLQSSDEISTTATNDVINYKKDITDVNELGYKGKGIKIAILDTGISVHSDLNVAGGVNFTSTDTNDYTDINGHGTKVAGIIKSSNDDKIKAGIANESDIYAVKITNDEEWTITTSKIILGLQWAMENDCDIVNMSFGCNRNSSILEDVINMAFEKGMILVAAAGNYGNGESVMYPAAFTNVVAVGSGNENKIEGFSNKSSKIDFLAEGRLVTTTLNNLYTEAVGTSYSCAYITAELAVVWEKDRLKTNKNILELTKSTSKKSDESKLVQENEVLDINKAISQFDSFVYSEEDVAISEENISDVSSIVKPILSEDTFTSADNDSNVGNIDEANTNEIDSSDVLTASCSNPLTDYVKSNATEISSYPYYETYVCSNDIWYKIIPSESSGAHASGGRGRYSFYTVDDVDTYGVLYSSDGSPLAQDNDGAGELDFWIDYMLTLGVTYYLHVTTTEQNPNRDHSFNMHSTVYTDEFGNTPETAANVATLPVWNCCVNGTTYPSDVDWFKFYVPENGIYDIYTTSNIDTYGELSGYRGGTAGTGYMCSNDDGGENLNYSLNNQYLYKDHEYKVKVATYSGEGNYSLNFIFKQNFYPYYNPVAVNNRMNCLMWNNNNAGDDNLQTMTFVAEDAKAAFKEAFIVNTYTNESNLQTAMNNGATSLNEFMAGEAVSMCFGPEAAVGYALFCILGNFIKEALPDQESKFTDKMVEINDSNVQYEFILLRNYSYWYGGEVTMQLSSAPMYPTNNHYYYGEQYYFGVFAIIEFPS